MSHAAAVAVYRSKYQSTQQGIIGITLNTDFAYPLDPNSTADEELLERYSALPPLFIFEFLSFCYSNLEFQAGWYADPVFFGRYPQSMVDGVGNRLPTFSRTKCTYQRIF